MGIEIGADWSVIQGDGGDEELAELAGEDDDVREASRLLAMSGFTEIAGHGRAHNTEFRRNRPVRGRFIDLPFPTVALAGVVGATVDAVARPQETFRPQRLIIDPVGGIAVQLIIIGRKVQFAAVTGAVSASTFSPVALGAQRHYDTAQISQDVIVRLVNLTAVAVAAIQVGFSGPAVD